ncbi:MAG: BrnA antitoxin family protein [Acidobacteriaceae bacterium]
MKQQYDFSKGKRGRITTPEPEQRGKTRITIRIDDDLVDHFLKEAERSGGSAGYQTLINDALRQHVEGKAPKLEDTLRRILREEIKAAS